MGALCEVIGISGSSSVLAPWVLIDEGSGGEEGQTGNGPTDGISGAALGNSGRRV